MIAVEFVLNLLEFKLRGGLGLVDVVHLLAQRANFGVTLVQLGLLGR